MGGAALEMKTHSHSLTMWKTVGFQAKRVKQDYARLNQVGPLSIKP